MYLSDWYTGAVCKHAVELDTAIDIDLQIHVYSHVDKTDLYLTSLRWNHTELPVATLGNILSCFDQQNLFQTAIREK